MRALCAPLLHRRLVRRRTAQLRIANQRGQALVETGIVVVLLVTLVMGVLEFGRAWMVISLIMQGAREGARAAAVAPLSSRDASGIINGATQTAVGTLVKGQIGTVLDPATVSAMTVTVTQPTVSGVNLVQVRVQGSVPLIFNLIGTSFAVDRSVTFRDEGR